MTGADSSEGGLREGLKMAVLAALAVGLPVLAVLMAGVEFVEFVSANARAGVDLVHVAYLIGVMAGTVGAIVVHGVLRTRVSEWWVYGNSYFETLRYPEVGDRD